DAELDIVSNRYLRFHDRSQMFPDGIILQRQQVGRSPDPELLLVHRARAANPERHNIETPRMCRVGECVNGFRQLACETIASALRRALKPHLFDLLKTLVD